MINKYRNSFQYDSGDLVYLISPLTSQLWTSSRKVTIKYIDPLEIYKIIDPLKLFINDVRWQNFERFIQT